MTDCLLSVQDVAETLATSADHVRHLIHARQLRAINISRGPIKPRFRVRREDLESYIAERTAAPSPTRRRRRRRG